MSGFKNKTSKKIGRIIALLGPGFITGASDDDPSGIATYAQTGAQFGYLQLWTAPYSLPFMIGIQEICARIGLVTGKGIARVAREEYARPVLFAIVAVLFIVNTINVGADLGAMAASAQLLFGAPFWIWLIAFMAVTLVLQISLPYPTYARYLKYLTLALLAYIFGAFLVTEPWREITWHTFIPTIVLSKDYLLNLAAVFGTTISAYLFFWEADLEAEEDYAHHRVRFFGKGVPRITRQNLRDVRVDNAVGMFMSNIISWFIFITAASTLHAHGITHIETANEAAEALRPLAGNLTYWLFAAGIIGAGLGAVPILAGSAAYALSEAFNWRAGLHYPFKRARAFYAIIIFATLLGGFVNLVHIKPFVLLYYTAVLNGIAAPIVMILIMQIANNKKVMGTYTNGWLSNTVGWTITVFMGIVALAAMYQFI